VGATRSEMLCGYPHLTPPARGGGPGGVPEMSNGLLDFFADMLALGRREAEHIAQAFPDVTRRVGGYLIDALGAGDETVTSPRCCAARGHARRLRAGSSSSSRQSPGTRRWASATSPASARPWRRPAHRRAGPWRSRCVDRTLIELARDIAMSAPP